MLKRMLPVIGILVLCGFALSQNVQVKVQDSSGGASIAPMPITVTQPLPPVTVVVTVAPGETCTTSTGQALNVPGTPIPDGTNCAIPAATLGVPYSFQLTQVTTGGVGPPYTTTWLLCTGSDISTCADANNTMIFPGLTLSNSGLVSGTPTAAGQFKHGDLALFVNPRKSPVS